jgi:hypothetical protein
MIRNYPALVIALVILVLGALPLHCIGSPLSEHNVSEMAHASGRADSCGAGISLVSNFLQAEGQQRI